MTKTQIFGIRHHGPGSARALRSALGEFRPDVVLIEGPPEADAIVELAADPQMTPPVALLAYRPGTESNAAFWPFAEFSPEWQAVQHAVTDIVPVRFCDLPAAHQLADSEAAPDEEVRLDPLGALAAAAGYDDPERWWEDVVEHRGGPSPFPAVAEAMTVLRAEVASEEPREQRREAHMRRVLRKARSDGFARIAVVCGAWHVPAVELALPPAERSGPAWPGAEATASGDDALLRGLPKTKVALTWVPWTHGRLTQWSGYGAGVRSPGWYRHLFAAADRPVERWLTDAARLLRGEDLHVSSAHVIEAVRLADTLAALRDRPLAGLDEVTEAVRAVLCEGADGPLELIHRRMVVGERLGAVPDRTPMVPLQRDVLDEQRRTRLKPAPEPRDHDFDLRKPTDLARSRLLHRLRLLGVPWGEPAAATGAHGTFHELWRLTWHPEYDVRLIEAGVWGTTVLAAATNRAIAEDGAALPELTGLAERCLLADLPDALPTVMRALADRAAADTDAAHLMAALPALVRALRYGDVRGTPTEPLRSVVDGLAVRICVGLPQAVSGLDDDAARALAKHIDAVQNALTVLDNDLQARWLDALRPLIDRTDLHGLLEGRLTRLLLDAGRLETTTPEETSENAAPSETGEGAAPGRDRGGDAAPSGGGARQRDPGGAGGVAARMARAVSVGQPPARAAAWVEGFLSGGGLVLVHDAALLGLVDEWITGLPADSFTDVLPLLRRAFAVYDAAERRAIGERVRAGGPSDTGAADDLDEERAAPAVRKVADILGWSLT